MRIDESAMFGLYSQWKAKRMKLFSPIAFIFGIQSSMPNSTTLAKKISGRSADILLMLFWLMFVLTDLGYP